MLYISVFRFEHYEAGEIAGTREFSSLSQEWQRSAIPRMCILGGRNWRAITACYINIVAFFSYYKILD